MELMNRFEKRHHFFSFIESWRLPHASELYSDYYEGNGYNPLKDIKHDLNRMKNNLNDFKIEEWRRHTRNRNPSELITPYLKKTIKAEFVTKAFAKFYECLATFKIADNPGKRFFSVHLCEAPGAFITSLNHYLKLNYPETEFKWLATTLNPYYEGNSLRSTILDDRFLIHTLDNWFFGDDYDGDITNVDNIRSLIKHCKEIGEVNLVTADGSIDCVDEPRDQEKVESKLFIAELVTGLAILAKGGTMVMKFSTFFETNSLAVLFILTCCFNKLEMFKPASSKEGNSEVYVIAQGFQKQSFTEAHIEKILENVHNDEIRLMSTNLIPDSFKHEACHAASLFYSEHQMNVIEKNIETFKKYNKHEFERINMLKTQMLEEYIRRFRIKPIKEHQKLLPNVNLNTDININQQVHSGSFAERAEFEDLDREDQLTILYDKLKKFNDTIPYQGFIYSEDPIILNPSEEPIKFLDVIHGKPIEKIESSKFVFMSLFKFFLELRYTSEEDPEFEGPWKESKPLNRNFIAFDMKSFKKAENYDAYEKDVALRIINEIIELKCQVITIARLPLFTQFLVGITFYIGSYVFEEIHFNRKNYQFHFIKIRPNGLENLNILKDTICQHRSSGLIGICDTRKLFNFNTDFYKSIIDYNNYICLRLCSFYLNNIPKQRKLYYTLSHNVPRLPVEIRRRYKD